MTSDLEMFRKMYSWYVPAEDLIVEPEVVGPVHGPDSPMLSQIREDDHVPGSRARKEAHRKSRENPVIDEEAFQKGSYEPTVQYERWGRRLREDV